jgi:hypothetical protein
VPAYYVCGGYVASGRDFCVTPRIPTTYLDDALLDGIQKRLERVVDPHELRRRLDALLPADQDTERAAAMLAARLRETETKIGRLVAALAAGPEDLPSVRATLAVLEGERVQLEGGVREAASRPVTDRAGLVGEMIASLANVREVLDAGEPEERRAVVRSFLAGIRVDRAAGRAVLRWYRPPQVAWVKLVAVGGIEPPTRGL